MLQCAITDGTSGLSAKRAGWLVDRCAELGAAGIDFLIVRERELQAAALVGFAREIVAAAGPMRVLVAGTADEALAAGAAGVHLSSRVREATVAAVRGEFSGAFVTRSCHTLAEVRGAREQGVDAVLFGPVFGKWVGGLEVVRGVGIGMLAEAVAAAGEMPVFALGGVTPANAALCRCAGVAAIRMFFA